MVSCAILISHAQNVVRSSSVSGSDSAH